MVKERSNLISKVNNVPRNCKHSETKAYFKAIYDDLFQKVDGSYEKLGNFIETK